MSQNESPASPIVDEHDGDPELLDRVEERIDEAKRAADAVEDYEHLGMHHRDGKGPGAFEPSSDDTLAAEIADASQNQPPNEIPNGSPDIEGPDVDPLADPNPTDEMPHRDVPPPPM